jgi:hypothetical protein
MLLNLGVLALFVSVGGGAAMGPDDRMELSAPPALGSLATASSCLVSAERFDGFPEYYAVELVPTRQVTGTGRSTGVAHVTSEASPFGIALGPDGSYRSSVHVQVDRLPVRRQGEFVAWATTPSLEEVVWLGVLDEDGFLRGTVPWNKFLVVITLEPEGGQDLELWTGPIVLRGMSRSGMMHTMAGHGPFEQVECQAFGY